jgi:hypothetical protein
MLRITIDPPTCEKLRRLMEATELCDESGRVVGRFFPVYDAENYEGLEPRISKEELQRRKEDKGKTYTTAEVLAHLEKL